MKKKFLTVLLCVAAVLCLCFGLAACGDNSSTGSTSGGSQTEQGGGSQTEQGGGSQTEQGSGSQTETGGGGNEQGSGSQNTPSTHVHAYGNWEIIEPATHTATGTRRKYCSCGDHIDETIPKTTEHTFLPYSHTDATCTEAGEDVLRCECGEEQHTTIPAEGHTYEKGVCSVCGSVEGLIAFRTLEVSDDDTVYGKVSNQTETFSFIQEILFADGVTFTVSYDLGGTNTIPTKTVSLEIGDNTYYILVTRGNDLKLYTVTVRRRPVYNVTFETSGSAVSSQQVEEDQNIVQPAATTRTGYTFRNWTLNGDAVTFPYKAEEGIPQTGGYNVTFTAVFSANDYKATFDAKGGEVAKGEQTVTFDQSYNFPVPTRTGYSFTGWYEGQNQLTNAAGASLSAWTYAEGKQIDAHWSANSYKLTVDRNLSDAGTVTGGGTFAYDSDVTVTATTKRLGYDFLGWYNEKDERVSEQASYTFPMGLEQTITAKWQIAPEMANFIFTSTLTTCTISGVIDKFVTEIFVPDYVTLIEGGAFVGCSGIEHISASMENQTYRSEGDCLIETKSKKLILGCENSKIPDSVTSIGSSAFLGCSGLTNIEVPDSVTSIGSSAFSGCSRLESMTLPFVGGSRKTASDTYQYPFGFIFGTSSFEGASAVKQCYYGSSTSTDTSSTYYIPDSLKSVTVTGGEILYGAFAGCSRLKNIYIPDNIVSIGKEAFYNCSGLTSFTIPNSVTTIGADAFGKCSGMIGALKIPNSVTTIGDDAFTGCSGLESIVIPNSVTTIGGNAFENCTTLQSVIWNAENCSAPWMNTYPIFKNCTYLKTVTFGEAVKTIPDSAFYGCSGLESVIWNAENCTTAGSRSYPIFEGCTNLKTVTFGENVKIIPAYALSYSGPESIFWDAEDCTVTINTFSGCTNLKTVTFGENVKTIPDFAFYGCSGLESVTIPNSVTRIGDYAFKDCDALKSVTIGNGVTSIGSSAFSSCDGLTSVIIPDSVTSIGSYAFYNCGGLTGVYITDLAAWCKIDFESSTANPLFYADHLYLDGDEVKDLTIPDEVMEIKQYAFYNCRGLESVTIGDGVTSIRDYAFYNCRGLESVTIGDGVTSIRDYAFYNCSGLTSITIPDSVTSIGSYAFYNCSGLESVTIGSSVTSIGSSAFYNCSGLKTVYYKGTPVNWSGISISRENDSLTNATRYYYSAQTPSAEQWAESENWWHYEADGETIVLWTKEEV